MPYSDFTLSDLKEKFGVKNQRSRLFSGFALLEPSEKLKIELAEAEEMSLRSEKAKSEWIVVPMLNEVRNGSNKYITIFSGENLNADPEQGLSGECDFIVAKETRSYEVNYPILQIVQARKSDMEIGIYECAAQMVGARVFNKKKGIVQEKLYGCSTTGNTWQFLELSDKLYIDINKYYLNEVGDLLGVFQHIINQFRQAFEATQPTLTR